MSVANLLHDIVLTNKYVIFYLKFSLKQQISRAYSHSNFVG